MFVELKNNFNLANEFKNKQTMETIITISYDNGYELRFKTSTQHMMHWIDEAEKALKMAGIKTNKWQIIKYESA